MTDVRRANATAHTNIALVKYWGKRDGAPDSNLPAVGSLSLTLDRLRTETLVEPAERDTMRLDDRVPADAVVRRAFAHVDRVWSVRHSAPRPPLRVVSTNHVPTAAGLASSASGFAALTLACAAAFGVELSPTEASALARRGSGSAARSLWGGFVRLDAGARDDGADCIARPLFGPAHWDVRMLIVHTAQGSKSVGSTAGMRRCSETSPYYDAWVRTAIDDLDEAEAAIAARDLERLGAVMEHSCFKMHAAMFASRPPLVYWNGATLDAIHAVWDARSRGWAGYVTSDAGPHVKILCPADESDRWVEHLRSIEGVHRVEALAPGPDPVVTAGADA